MKGGDRGDMQRTLTAGVDREHTADWAMALVPTAMMAVLYYRLVAVVFMTVAVGGALAAAYLLLWCTGRREFVSLWGAVTGGVLAACCLPATAPWWLPALMGGAVAAATVGVSYTRPWRLTFHPALLVLVLVRMALPSVFDRYTVPLQYVSVDDVAVTPLALVKAQAALPEWWRLLFGVHAAAIGEGCAVAILLGFLVLALRRRVRLIAPACLLLTVFGLSWAVYGTASVAAALLLSGGCLLGAWMLSDTVYAPATAADQAVVGVVAGVVTVLVRRFGPWDEGIALGVIAGQALVPVLPYVYRGLAMGWQRFWPLCGRVWAFLSGQFGKLIKKEK